MATINGYATSWSNVQIVLDGKLSLQTIKSLKYGKKVNVEYVRGAGRTPYDYTDGTIEFSDITLEVSPSDHQNLLTFIQDKYGQGTVYDKNSQFDIVVTYALDAAGSTISTDTLKRCRVISYDQAPAEGAGAIVVAYTLKCLDIVQA